jgi:hypothetical protein
LSRHQAVTAASARAYRFSLPSLVAPPCCLPPTYPRRVCSRVDVGGISQVPRRSVPCLASFQDPDRTGAALPHYGLADAAPASFTAKASAEWKFRGCHAHLLATLHEWCCHYPCKARFRRADLPLPEGSRDPLDRYKRFQITFSFSSSGFILAQEGSSLISCILIKSDARADTSNRTMSFNNPAADDQNIPDVLAES